MRMFQNMGDLYEMIGFWLKALLTLGSEAANERSLPRVCVSHSSLDHSTFIPINK